MKSHLNCFRSAAVMLAVAAMLSGISSTIALAQTAPPAATAVSLPEATIRSLQEALNKQGIAVKADGVLNDETRAAIRRYQTLHHLPVTGEPDKATLDKLGVAASQGAASPPAQSPPPAAGQAEMPASMMMSGPMMQGMMQGMMQTMQGMMGMMKGQMQPGQTQPGPTRPPQGGMMMNCPMMPGATQDQGTAPAMMQMMQGMMQMMKMIQGQMPPNQMQPGAR